MYPRWSRAIVRSLAGGNRRRGYVTVPNPIITAKDYETLYAKSIDRKESHDFWLDAAKTHLTWTKEPTTSFSTPDRDLPDTEWFRDGELNVSENCLDRHVREGRGDRVAFHWEPDDPSASSVSMTYRELLTETERTANALKDLGVGKGDTVCVCMGMTPEVVTVMLACARIGAVHSVIFGGFTGPAIASRIEDCSPKVVVTSDEGRRAGKAVALKANVDAALRLDEFDTSSVRHVVVARRTGNPDVAFDGERGDVWLHDVLDRAETSCAPEVMSAEDPLFILYTSGSTGKPKGVQHTTAGYLLHAAMTHRHVFDYRDEDVYWCTADVGWITGHSYITYGPLANGATSVLYEGVPNYPTPSRIWEICDKFRVSQVYTSPTAIRALMAEGDDHVQQTERSSLRVLGTVGEPINPEAWRWFYDVVGEAKRPIVDTYWQTETGGMMMTPLPGAIEAKPGSCTKPYFGVEPELLDDKGNVLEGEAEGNLCVARSWPGQLRTLYGNHERFLETYFGAYPGRYFTGDRARRDEDGYFWITGRTDDVLNVSGHRLGTAEVESALVLHDAVAEAAVVGYPHDRKGQGIYAYVSLMSDAPEWTDSLRDELVKQVRAQIGPIATPDFVQHADGGLPKTRSGKIMRRMLRKIAEGEVDDMGDTTTLQDPSVVSNLLEGRMRK